MLPSLNALRAFEAAARHRHFGHAGDELCVTQGAISRQVKVLEEQLGVRLFERHGKRLTLTAAGRDYLPVLSDAFARIAEQTRLIRARAAGGRLTVSVVPSFSARWLAPRLSGFAVRHPGIALRIVTSNALATFIHDGIDIGIRYGRGPWPQTHAELLAREELFPVCAPSLLSGPCPLRTPNDLRHHALLHGELAPGWAEWLKAAGVSGIDVGQGPRFTDAITLLEAAFAGHGVALARSVLVRDDLASGRLIRPFATAVAAEGSYHIVCAPTRLDQPEIAAFRDWLKETIRA